MEAVYRLLLQGDSLSNICENSRKSWGVSASQVYRYAQRARALIKKEAARIREEAFDEHLIARRRMRKDAHDAADKRLAFDILKDETKLLDLYPMSKMDITSKGERIGSVSLTEEQRAKALEQLAKYVNGCSNTSPSISES